MREMCSEMVLKCQKCQQKRLNDSQLNQISLNRAITGEQSWVFEYDPETKRRSEEWHTSQISKTEENSRE
jgi:hypothetical protein